MLHLEDQVIRRNTIMRLMSVSLLLVVATVSAVGILSGCSGQAKPYPQAKVATPVGKPGQCAFCKKKVANVEQKHLATIQGIRYVLCNEKCKAGMEKRVKHQ